MMKDFPTPVALTQHLVTFDTTNPPGREHACTEYLGRLLESAGFTTEFYEFAPGRTTLIARLEGTARTVPLCFSGHVDTVPPGAAPWQIDPFKGKIAGNKIYGRGTADMKGGIAAMVIACLRIARLAKEKANIMMILSAGEETGCQGAYHLAANITSLGKAGALVIGEPTSNYPFIGHKGALFAEAQISGTAAHGSMPDTGVNAVYRAAEVVTKLQHFDFHVPPHAIYGTPTLNVGTIQGGTTINMVPDRALIGIDIRTIPGQRTGNIIEQLQQFLGEDVTLTCLTAADGVSTDPDHEWMREVFGITKSYLREQPIPRIAPYFTDASALKPALGNPPTVILGPGEPDMAHKTDEYCTISNIETATEIYTEIALKWYHL